MVGDQPPVHCSVESLGGCTRKAIGLFRSRTRWGRPDALATTSCSGSAAFCSACTSSNVFPHALTAPNTAAARVEPTAAAAGPESHTVDTAPTPVPSTMAPVTRIQPCNHCERHFTQVCSHSAHLSGRCRKSVGGSLSGLPDTRLSGKAPSAFCCRRGTLTISVEAPAIHPRSLTGATTP